MPLLQLFYPKIRYMGDNKRLLVLDALRDINALAIHNNKLARERYENQFLAYPVPEIHVGHKVLIINYVRDVSDP